MDDLDHSVLIAEQDWDCFCTESEECSVEQAKLAALDESGFSDSDDDKTSIHASSLPITNSPEQLCEKDENLKQHQIGECKIKHSSEKPENPNPETEPQDADQMSNDRVHQQECQNKANEDSTLTETIRENDENQENGRHKSSQATTEQVSEMSTANINHGNSKDGKEKLTEVMDSSAATIKEKERWFVTVNDSPVRLRVKRSDSVQKKRRKKKLCKKSKQNVRVMEDGSSLNNKTEADIKIIERQTTQDKCEQENVFSDSPNIQNVQIQDNSSTGSYEDEEEQTSCALYLKKENMTEFPEAKLERNPADSPNSDLTPKQLPHMIFKDLSGSLPQLEDHGSSARDKLDESIEDDNSECQHTDDNLSHLNNNTGTENPRFILGTAPSLDSEQEKAEEPLGLLSYNAKESSPETQSFKTPGPTPPIFAISSFWDEMEKLTINDILQLRIANSRSQPTENIVPEESNHVDVEAHFLERVEVESKNESLEDGLVDDIADSDYFTHLDDSKPDRSSCEFSTFSDFDEEFIQLLHASANPSPDLLESKEQTFLESMCAVDLKETLPSESNEIVKMFPEINPVVYSMCSETEMQDLFLTTKEDNNMNTLLLDQCSMRRSTPSPVLSVSDILDDQCLLSFFEIPKIETELEQYQTWIPSRKSLLCFTQHVSLAETYDDFFSEFEVGNFLFPSLQGSRKSEKTMVPIYSSSCPVVRGLELPEVDEVINENAPIRVMSPSETSNMCFITSQRSTWRNLSLRHSKLLMGRTWCGMATSWSFPKTANIVCNYGTKTTLSSSIAHSSHPLLLLENQALGQMTEHKTHIGETVANADRDRFLFSLKQADMCLVCIAFASWVLKSSNPQSTDMWKTALLANVSAISAIQYLRRYVKEG